MRLANAENNQCQACCFYRLIELKSGKTRKLCALTGKKRPLAGMAGCRFTPGRFAEMDSILRLPKSRLYGNLNFPNTTKQVTAFSKNGMNVADTHALDDFSVTADNHISEKLKRQFVRPEFREDPVARSARERTDCLFHV